MNLVVQGHAGSVKIWWPESRRPYLPRVGETISLPNEESNPLGSGEFVIKGVRHDYSGGTDESPQVVLEVYRLSMDVRPLVTQ